MAREIERLRRRLAETEAHARHAEADLADLHCTVHWTAERYTRLSRGCSGPIASQATNLDDAALAAERTALQLIRSSVFFDPDFYLETNADVRTSEMDPAVHYLRYGGGEGRDPSIRFSTRNYLEANPDVAASGVNPLVHYELRGRDEGRVLRPPWKAQARAAVLYRSGAARLVKTAN